MNNRLINTKVAGSGGGGCTDIVDNYDPFGDSSGFALYQLNGNANDVSGAYNGNPIDVSWGSPGVFGASALLNGTTSYIDTSISSNIFNNDCSFSFWGKTTDTGNNCFFGTYNAQTALVECFFNLTTGQLRVYFRNSAASTVAVSSTFSNMNDGNWHHVVVTKTNSTIKAYVDGNAEINAAIPGGTYGNSTTIKLGRRQSITSTDENFNGPIDQVRFFNRELDPLEVEALYTEELCICDGTVDTLDILGDGSCIATYQLDGNANDLSGNYSGTPTDVSYDIGYFDRAGVFNGTSSSIEVPSGLRKNNDFTASIWFNTNSTTDGQAPINFRNGKKFAVSLNNSNVGNGSIRVNAGNNTAVDSAVGIFTTNTWYNLVVVQSSVSGVTVYLNNSVVASNSGATGDLVTVTGLDCIGSYDGTLSFFDGSIDQFRYFNKALNSSEVTTLYNETACTKPSGSLEVGDFVEGGVVYWVDPSDDTKGLVVSINDLGFIRFCVDSLKDNIPSTSESLGQSKNSTDTIVGVIGTSASNAAGLCRSYDDNTWDLPTRGDMQQMYANKDLLNSKFSSLGGNSFKGASSQWYWTSGFFSQYESAREYRFSNGASELGTVITLNYVRACKQVGNW